jgi:hypothetical protein
MSLDELTIAIEKLTFELQPLTALAEMGEWPPIEDEFVNHLNTTRREYTELLYSKRDELTDDEIELGYECITLAQDALRRIGYYRNLIALSDEVLRKEITSLRDDARNYRLHTSHTTSSECIIGVEEWIPEENKEVYRESLEKEADFFETVIARKAIISAEFPRDLLMNASQIVERSFWNIVERFY